MAQSGYFLPPNSYSGSVAGVSVSYNEFTRNNTRNLQNLVLKKFMENAAISAALSRGFSNVLIRSMPHASTIIQGQRVDDVLHMTVSVGNGSVAAHIPCYGLEVNAPNWYTYMTYGEPKWSDRSTSSNVSGAGSSAGSSSPANVGTGGSISGGWWARTESNVPGQMYVWWDGTRYTDRYS